MSEAEQKRRGPSAPLVHEHLRTHTLSTKSEKSTSDREKANPDLHCAIITIDLPTTPGSAMTSDVTAASHKAVDATEELDDTHNSNTSRELSSAGGNSSSPLSGAPAAEAIIAVDDIVIQPRGKLSFPALYIPSAPISASSSPARQQQRSPLSLSIPSLDKTQRVGPQNFEKIRILGAGATGRVYLVKSIGLPTEGFYAMKVVKKSELVKRNRVQRILTEKQILSVANHPFVVTLHYSFQTSEYFYLIMQYCAGGEFFSFLRRQEKHRLSEAHAKFYASEVLIALEYLHLLGIIYRDLKPENILVHESGHIMLSDFDLAHELKSKSGVAVSPTSSFMNVTGFSSSSCNSPIGGDGSQSTTSLGSSSPLGTQENSLWFRVVDQKRSTISPNALPASRSPLLSSCLPSPKCLCGTPITYPMMDTESHMEMGEKRTSFVGTHEYVAPEIIAEEGYVGSVDWWAFGILLYEMIYGTTPFKGSTQIQTLENILDLSEEIDFPQEVDVSEGYKDLVRKLLAKTVSRRLQNPLEIKAHPFFREVVWPLIRHQKPPIVPDFVHTLKEKQFSMDEIDAFDDEVPYARGVSSPNTPRRKESSSASTTPCASPRAIPPGSPENLQFTFDATPATAVSEALPSPPHSPNTRTSQTNISDQATAVSSDASAADGNANLSGGDVVMEGESPVTVHNFDYAGGSKPGYWSSAESSRALHQKLSEMRLAVPEEELSESQCE